MPGPKKRDDSGNPRRGPASPDKRKLRAESLEDRILLSATWADADGNAIDDATNQADVFNGGDGNDIVNALDGDDELFGNDRHDRIQGGEGDDTIDGGTGNDILRGEQGDDVIAGGDGNDHLIGDVYSSASSPQSSGADVLDGGAGNDTLVGGLGDDIIIGGEGSDTVRFYNADDGVDVDLVTGTSTGEGNDTLIGIENVQGTSAADTIRGDDGANRLESRGGADVIEGRGGDDRIIGAEGALSLDGGEGSDTVSGAGNWLREIDIDLAEGTAFDGTKITNFENVEGGFSHDTLTGDERANLIWGNFGNDTIAGGGGDDVISGDARAEGAALDFSRFGEKFDGIFRGDDTIDGGAGNDVIRGDYGDDTLSGGLGDDTLDGGTGDDTADYSNEAGPMIADLSAGTVTNPGGTDTLIGIERIVGTDGDDMFLLDAANPPAQPVTIDGGGGNNTLAITNAAASDVTVDSEAGTVTVSGVTVVAENINAVVIGDTSFDPTAPAAIALDASVDVAEDGAVVFSSVGSDAVQSGRLSDISITTEPAHGTVTVAEDGTITYTPNADFNGTDEVTYTVTDVTGEVTTATATIDVTPVADAPIISAGDVGGVEGTPIALDLSATSATANDPVTEVVISGVPDGAVLSADVSVPVQNAIEVTADGPVTVTFEGEEAAYRNSVGFYTIQPDGTISNAEMAWENASQTGSGGSLSVGESSFTIDASAGDRIGVFTIANGDRANDFDDLGAGSFEFRAAGGAPATVASGTPELWHVADDGSETRVNGNVWHAASGAEGSMNPDGISHARMDLSEDGSEINIGFEDLTNGGDRDFDDVRLSLSTGNASLSEADGDAGIEAMGDGRYRVAVDALDSLTITPPDGFTGEFELGVTASSGGGEDIASSHQTLTVDVAAENEIPTLVTTDAGGLEDSPVTLSINATLDVPDAPPLSIEVSGVPEGATLSAGIDNGDGSWTLTAEEVDGVRLNPAPGFSGEFTVDVTASNTDGGTAAVQTATIDVSIAPVADAPVIEVADGAGEPGAAIPLDVGVTSLDPDGSETVVVTISNIPDGVTLSAGIDNGDGTWTLAAEELDGLTVTPPAGFDGALELEVTATASEIVHAGERAIDLTDPGSFDVHNGDWNIAGDRLVVSDIADETGVITLPNTSDLGNRFEVSVTYESQSQPDQSANGWITFGNETGDEFIHVGARGGANHWIIGTHDQGHFEKIEQLDEDISESRSYDFNVKVDGNRVELFVDGEFKIAHEFDHPVTGPLGLAAQNTNTAFSNFRIDAGQQASVSEASSTASVRVDVSQSATAIETEAPTDERHAATTQTETETEVAPDPRAAPPESGVEPRAQPESATPQSPAAGAVIPGDAASAADDGQPESVTPPMPGQADANAVDDPASPSGEPGAFGAATPTPGEIDWSGETRIGVTGDPDAESALERLDEQLAELAEADIASAPGGLGLVDELNIEPLPQAPFDVAPPSNDPLFVIGHDTTGGAKDPVSTPDAYPMDRANVSSGIPDIGGESAQSPASQSGAFASLWGLVRSLTGRSDPDREDGSRSQRGGR